MQITILCVGKIKEAFFRDAITEYSKRLSRYCKLNIVEVADEQTPDNASEAMEDQIRAKEADRILSKIPDNTGGSVRVITLEINGKKYTSEKLSKRIDDLGINGISHIVFIIGGSLGLHKKVTDRADENLSFSDMTFPHQLMRVILLEQIYRCYRISHNEPYHK